MFYPHSSPEFHQPLLGVILLLALVLCSSPPALASPTDTTTIIVVGTVHHESEKFTVRGLSDIVERIKPDLILVELDSTFFSPSMSIKPEFVRISLENEVVAQYQKGFGVPIRPYDIEGRNTIYKNHNYFKLQSDLSKALNQAFQDSLLHGESAMVLDAIDRFDRIGQSFGAESPRIINSYPCDVAMESKQYYAGEGMLNIVTSVPELKLFSEFAKFRRDFWIQRNDAMVANILTWIKRLHPQTILVFCGFEHRYYLRKSLKTHCIPDALILREYWTY